MKKDVNIKFLRDHGDDPSWHNCIKALEDGY